MLLSQLDVSRVLRDQTVYADLVDHSSKDDVCAMTAELYAAIDEAASMLVDDEAAHRQPTDPGLPEEEAWSFARVTVHILATCEEGAARASTLARGIPAVGRSRHEPDCAGMTVGDVQSRIRESRGMVTAFLATWPHRPHLDVTARPIPRLGPANAIGMHALGLTHAWEHVPQLRRLASLS